MLRVAREGAISRQLGIVLLLTVIVAILGVWALITQPTDGTSEAKNRADKDRPEAQFFEAIRDNDKAVVKQLLSQGVNPNSRDDAGDTALMRAALYADLELMQVLLSSSANARLRAQDGSSPLLRTTHDLDKMRLMLDNGATVDDFVMLATASVPGSRKALELLVSRGGKARSATPAYTPLMAAATNGDLEAVTYLLEQGANVNSKTPTGFTALIGAALSGNSEVVARLLERGAEPNVVSKLERGILQTPASVAASMGHAECLRLLIAAGADVNVQGGPFQHHALLGAATTPSLETVRLLLPKADSKVTDWSGRTALDWAICQGETETVKLLRNTLPEPSKPIPPAKAELFLREPIHAELTRRAVTIAVPLLQESERVITETRSCVSCHQHPLVTMTVSLARKCGVKVDETIASAERLHIEQDMRGRLRPLLLGTGIDPTLSVHVLAGMAADEEPASRVTDALVHYLMLRQRKDGRWQQENYRPPDEASDFQFTALAVRGLQVYAPKGRRPEIAIRLELARRWLENTRPKDTTDRGFQLMGLGWAQASPESITKAVTQLINEQRNDGGWSQLPTLNSDAYATGLALYALHIGGGVSVDHTAYKRGVEFLLKTQHADGSWFVSSRSFPIVEFTRSGFPHGRSQFISAAATCWATMALALATPAPVR